MPQERVSSPEQGRPSSVEPSQSLSSPSASSGVGAWPEQVPQAPPVHDWVPWVHSPVSVPHGWESLSWQGRQPSSISLSQSLSLPSQYS